MKFVLILVVVSIVAAQIVYAQHESKGKSGEHKPQNPGKSGEHKPQKAGGAAALHRFRRNPQDAQASGNGQVSAGGQAGGNLGQMSDKAKQMAAQMVGKAKQMAEHMKDKLHQMRDQHSHANGTARAAN